MSRTFVFRHYAEQVQKLEETEDFEAALAQATELVARFPQQSKDIINLASLEHKTQLAGAFAKAQSLVDGGKGSQATEYIVDIVRVAPNYRQGAAANLLLRAVSGIDGARYPTAIIDYHR